MKSWREPFGVFIKSAVYPACCVQLGGDLYTSQPAHANTLPARSQPGWATSGHPPELVELV